MAELVHGEFTDESTGRKTQLPLAADEKGRLIVSGSTPGGSGGADVVTAAEAFTVQTASSGASWVALPSIDASRVRLENPNPFSIEYRRDGGGESLQIRAGMYREIDVVDNADEISVRRVDQSNTQLTLVGEATVTVAGGVHSASIWTAQTPATGSNWTTLPSLVATRVRIENDNVADIEYRRGDGGTSIPVYAGTFRLVSVVANLSELSFRRVDQSNVQVTIKGEVTR